MKKGADYTDAIRKDLAEYEKCFYSAAELRKSDVLRRKYLPLRRVLVKVKAWAAARGGARGAWRPIGFPSRSHSGAEVRRLMALCGVSVRLVLYTPAIVVTVLGLVGPARVPGGRAGI